MPEKRYGLKVLISLHGFRFQSNIRKEFKKLHKFLADDELAVIFLFTWSPYFSFLLELCDHPVWSVYMKNTKDNIPDYFMKPRTKDYFQNVLVDTGFSIISCIEEYKCKSFSCDEECKEVEKGADLRSLRRKDCCLFQRRTIRPGVPQGPYEFEEIALFEQYLKIQIVFEEKRLLPLSKTCNSIASEN
ncbi:hypothetical protein TNIN_76801 [Trichonephila inaurata madagascariensis]|uniref:Uncharacterized protein n=1 Tax=Trichonephila inaurata madagascariensis TaxID=2747483 RepID=A0A8X7C2L8_9ARAC|nr:hypothetical protein TNIN_76801 [Trichonephila inaurata madagascariensis]